MKKIFLGFAVLILSAFALRYVSPASAAENLTIRKLTFVESFNGLGDYIPWNGTRFTLDDICGIYIETSGFKMPLTPDTQDEYNINLAVDVAVRLPQSRRLRAFQPNMATLVTKVRSELPAYFIGFGFELGGWTPGNYLLEVGLRDNFGGQVVSQDLTFQLVEPTEADVKARLEREAREAAAQQQ